MKTRTIDLIIAVIFTIFAALQLNDPDPWLWVLIYGLVVLVALFSFFQKSNVRITAVILFCIIGYIVRYIGPFVQWMQQGMPSITGEMQASSPHVELVREFLGLILVTLVLVYYLRRSKRVV